MLWKYPTGNSVYSVAISPNGYYIVTGSADGKIYYLTKDGSRKWSYYQNPPVNSVDISSDGGLIVGGFENGDILLLNNQANIIWETHKKIPILLVEISRDGSYIGVGSYNEGTNKLFYFDKRGILWSYITEGKVIAISQSSNGDYFAGGTDNGRLYLLNKKGDVLWSYNLNALISGIKIFPQEQYIAVSAVRNNLGKLSLFNLDGNLLWEYPGSFNTLSLAGDKIIAGSFDGNIYLFNSDGAGQKPSEISSKPVDYGTPDITLKILDNLYLLLIIPIIALLYYGPRIYWETRKIRSKINKMFHKYRKPSFSINLHSSVDTSYIPLSLQNSEGSIDDNFEELLLNGDYDGAIDRCDAVLKNNDKDPIALNNKAIVYSLIRRFSEAENILDKAISLDKTNSILWYNKGKILTNQEKFSEAVKAFEQSLLYDPNNFFIVYDVGLARLQYLEKTEAFQKMIRADLDNVLSDEEYNLILSLYVDAFKIFDKIKPVINDFPGFQSKILLNQAYIMYVLRHFEKSIEFVNNALSLNFLNNEANNLQEAIRSDLLHYENKIRLCKLLLKLYPRMMDVWNSLARCLCVIEEYDMADKICQYSIKINPENNPADLIQKEIRRKSSELNKLGINSKNTQIPESDLDRILKLPFGIA